MNLKEIYFTKDSLPAKAREFLASLAGIKSRPQVFVPESAALLVLDMQGYFLDEFSHAFIPSAPAILPAVNNLIQAFMRRGLPVFLTRHINTPENAGLMASWWHDIINLDDPLCNIDDRILPGYDRVIIKTRYDAFFDTPLEDLLRELNVKQVVICGVMTHLCCETTARSAFMRGFEVFFTVDGTATYSESFHRASLLNLAHGFAMPILVEKLLEELYG